MAVPGPSLESGRRQNDMRLHRIELITPAGLRADRASGFGRYALRLLTTTLLGLSLGGLRGSNDP